MSEKSVSTKEKILNATLELLNEYNNTNDISLRTIAKRAGITVGLINYHFQTKENLINLAVQTEYSKMIGMWDNLYSTLKGSPIEKLRFLVRGIGEFMSTKPLFTRISFIQDLFKPSEDDNSQQTFEKYIIILREIYGKRKKEQEVMIITHTLLSALIVAFLRVDMLKKSIGYDFFIESQRNEFMDILINNIIQIDELD